MLSSFSPNSVASRVCHDEGDEDALFREHGTLLAIWLLAAFVAMGVIGTVRAILEPILWAFFLVMGLGPLTDLTERALLCFCKACRRQEDETKRRGEAQAKSRPVVSSSAADLDVRGVPSQDASGPELDEVTEESSCTDIGFARTTAVAIVLCGFIGCAALFFVMVYKSALHMKSNWTHYENGADALRIRTQAWMAKLPDKVMKELTTDTLSGMEEALSSLAGGVLDATTSTLVQMLWLFLYTTFWLCQPVYISRRVSSVFRRYIFLKGIASAGYAFCIWILLHFLGVDLAIVFGLITFVLNFIPEIGPFISMMLPLPVILFDDRVANPLQSVALALVGQMLLKVVWGNIVEIKLIESQQEMRMHPVVILFFVALFQFFFGATGMLLSVPLVAALKATLHRIPPAYRDPILIFLEGDKAAPVNWRLWRESLEKSDSALA